MNKIRTGLYLIIFFFNVSLAYTQKDIGIALPLMKSSESADEKKLGEQMLKGINDALGEYNKTNPVLKINIRVEDTKREQSEALQIFNKFGSDTNTIAILGPVFSSELINNEGAAAFHKIPIITPTATQNFLAERNQYLFQLNPTYDIRGRLMADFADKKLNMKNFAIFSEESYGKNFADSFSDEVVKNGGEIIHTQYYPKENQDLTEEMDELKNKIFEKEKFIDFGTLTKSNLDKLKKVKFRFSYPDSLVRERLVVSVYRLFGMDALRVLDSIGVSASQIKNPNNTTKYILGYTDAVYIPISSSEEMSKVAPQYFSGNINLPILGTSDWNNESQLEENRIYINRLFFDSDFYIEDKTGLRMKDIEDSEIRNYYFAYDAMKLILDKISEGNSTRLALNDALEKVNNYKAVHCYFTIKERTNNQMMILKFENGKLEKSGEFIH